MRITLMHNPKAGVNGPSADELLEALRRAGYEPEYQSTKKKDYARALEDPGELVVVAGGDGTVAKVATRMAGRGIPLAILPLGTANNIASSLGVVGEAEEIIAAWKNARRRKFDIGVVSGPWGESRFLEAVGFGLFTQAMALLDSSQHMDAEPEDTREELSRDLRFLRMTLASCRARSWSLTLDGEAIAGEFLMLEIMNTPCLGPNLCLAPRADPGDGRLDVVLLHEEEREEFTRYLEARLRDTGLRPRLEVRRGRRVHLPWDGSPLHVDGDIYADAEPAAGDAAAGAGGDSVIDVWLESEVEILVGR